MVKIRTNDIFEKNRQGKKGIGLGLVFPCPEAIELVGMLGGFDYVNLDAEHGLFSPESIDEACRIADGFGLTVTARVPNINPSTINLFMDRGVIGILGPHIENAEDAKALVDACRFPPEGKRSWGGGRGTFYNDSRLIDLPEGDRREFMTRTNKEVLVMAQLESKTAYENLEEILAVPGIDAFAGGPNDLAASFGYPGQPAHPDVLKETRKINERIHAAGRKLTSDLMAAMGLADLIVDAALEFRNKHQ